MKYGDFLTAIRKNKIYIFTVDELSRYFPGSTVKTIQNQVQSWTEQELLVRLRRGVYKVQFPEGGPNLPDLYIANRLYEPSYVSLETALSFYSLIPDVAAEVTSVTTRQTKLFQNKFGSFKYSSCKNEAYCGYKIMPYEDFKVYIAEKEKALVDFVYFKHRYGEKIDIEAERFDQEKLKESSWDKIFYYAALYNKRTLSVLKEIRGKLE